MRIIVSGNKSGLGRYLFESLGAIGLDRNTSFEKREDLKKKGADIIIHCAFNYSREVSSQSLFPYFKDNVLLTKELAMIPHKKFIFISSVDVYPKNREIHKENEIIGLDSIEGIYGITKLISESIVRNYCKNHLILRGTAFLGKYSRKNSLIKIIKEKNPSLTLSPKSDFNYVLYSDVADFLKTAIKKDLKGIYNLASSENITLTGIARTFKKKVKFGKYQYSAGKINNKIFYKKMKSQTKKKILVCGTDGFIGRNMAEAFAGMKGYEVYGTYLKSKPFNNPQIAMVRADLTDRKDVESVIKGKDIVIQAAATTSGAKEIAEKPYYHVTDNALMNSLIFRSAYDNHVGHVVFFSCTVMYQSGKKPLKETDFNANDAIYPNYFGVGWTKVYIEKIAEFYSRIGETKYTIIRHSNMYGPYDKFDLERSHVFGATMTKVMTTPDGGKFTVWGEGKEGRDLMYVSDLVDFAKLAVVKQRSKFELYNAGLGKAISVADLVKKIIRHSGKSIGISYDKSKPSFKTKLCLDCSKAKKELGWSPKVSLDEGIDKTMNWLRSEKYYDNY